ncbi:DUF4240 domain-containing protein [Catenulispora sp. EB89]|uniref:DUF4240 domain-containing protein n=1 Tax=Catenulispora sp. EB89 TaxID=3156257 RepID=UPI0035198B5C
MAAVDEDSFWRLIEYCTPDSPDPGNRGLVAALIKTLGSGPVYRVVGFAEQLSWALYRLDRNELAEGHSGDSFLYARAGAVAAGRTVYESVLADPRVFEQFTSDGAEELLYVPDRVYLDLTGEEWDRRTRYSYESYSNDDGWAKG